MTDFLDSVSQALGYDAKAKIRELVKHDAQPLLSALHHDPHAPRALLVAVSQHHAPVGESFGKIAHLFDRATHCGYEPTRDVLRGYRHLLKSVSHELKLAAQAKKHAEQREKAKFWNRVADVAISIASSPVFTAVIGVATAAIPGIGAALAPVAMVVQRKVTAMVDEARHGQDISAGEVLQGVAEVAEAGTSVAAPGVSAAIQSGVKTAEEVQATAKTIIATARAYAHPEIAVPLTEARKLIARTHAGDCAAYQRIHDIAERASRGDHAAIKSLALITAVVTGMSKGHIPPIKASELRIVRPIRPIHFAPFGHPALPHIHPLTGLPKPGAVKPACACGPKQDDEYEEQYDGGDDDFPEDEYDESGYAVGNGIAKFQHTIKPIKKKQIAAFRTPIKPISKPKPFIQLHRGLKRFQTPIKPITRPGAMANPKGITMAKIQVAPGAIMKLHGPVKAQMKLHSLGVTPAQALILTRAAEQGGKSMLHDAADKMGLPTEAALAAEEMSTEMAGDDEGEETGALTEEETAGYDAEDEYETEYDDGEGYGYGGGGYWPSEYPRDGSTYGWDD